jgi:hypothetical protein
MKVYGGVELIALPLFTSALDGGGWSVSRPDRVTPRESASRAHFIGDFEGPGAGMDVMGKRKISWPCREPNVGSSAVQLVA